MIFQFILGAVMVGAAWTNRASEFSVVLFVEGMILANHALLNWRKGRSLERQ